MVAYLLGFFASQNLNLMLILASEGDASIVATWGPFSFCMLWIEKWTNNDMQWNIMNLQTLIHIIPYPWPHLNCTRASWHDLLRTPTHHYLLSTNLPQPTPQRNHKLTSEIIGNHRKYHRKIIGKITIIIMTIFGHFMVKLSAGPPLGGATRLRRSAVSPKSSASAPSPKLMLWPRK